MMGSSFKQSYFSDARHAIQDARHSGSLIHDVNLQIAGPAVVQIDKTFSTFWKSTTDEPLVKFTPVIGPKPEGDNVASVQVLRTLPGGIFKKKEEGDEDLPHGETGILEAYQRAIHNAKRFIYIENQYFTSPEIVDALMQRLNDTSKPKLQLIFVLNFRPDLPGYPSQQIDIINKLRGAVSKNGHQMGVYTIWSRDETPILGSPGKTKFEIMPIYVHSKVAIIDDTWATAGTANLDGTSMNYHQVGLLVGGYFGDKLLEKITLEHDIGKFLGTAIWMVIYFVFKQTHWVQPENFAADRVRINQDHRELQGIFGGHHRNSRYRRNTRQHPGPPFTACPSAPRPHSPGAMSRLNLVIYNDIAGQPKNKVIQQLRQRLWQEHLGLAALPAELQNVPEDPAQMKWVDFWDNRADANQEAIQEGAETAQRRKDKNPQVDAAV